MCVHRTPRALRVPPGGVILHGAALEHGHSKQQLGGVPPFETLPLVEGGGIHEHVNHAYHGAGVPPTESLVEGGGLGEHAGQVRP